MEGSMEGSMEGRIGLVVRHGLTYLDLALPSAEGSAPDPGNHPNKPKINLSERTQKLIEA